MTLVADYSCARRNLAALKAAGVEGVARYLAPLPNWCPTGDGLPRHSKVINGAEYAAIMDAGLTVTLMWEWTNFRALDGASAGTIDGGEAARLFLQRGVIGYGMQVGAWSASVSSLCHLYQRLTPTALKPFVGQVDEDAILKPDYGQVPRPAGAQLGGPVLPQLVAPICAGVVRPQDDGYWVIGHDGGIFSFGNAPSFEPVLVTPDSPQEIIDAKCTQTGQGLYLFGADGGVFTFGDAAGHFQGSLAAQATPSSLPPRG